MTAAGALRWLGVIGVLLITVLRCMVVFAPIVVFDVDPVLDPMPLLGLGPAGSLLLDVLLLLFAVTALLGEWLSGRGLRPVILMLALLPGPIVLWHGTDDAGDLWTGSTWLAGMIACAAVAHLARERRFQILLTSVLLAAVVPVLTRGVVQIAHENPATVAFYEQNKDAILRDRGWLSDSAAAQIYERRLRDPQPLGWFSTSNIFASLAAFGVVAWFGLSIAAARTKLQSGWAGAMMLVAGFAAVMLWMSGSKGAALATIAGLFVVILGLIVNRWLPSEDAQADSPQRRRERRVKINTIPSLRSLKLGADYRMLGGIVLVLIALALVGVIMRGTLLPESFANEKSLLFRWHYMSAAARIFMESVWLGVGPDGFQAAYMLHRVPRNPEEVASAHSVFLDWLCTLGISSAAWIALVVMVLTAKRGLGTADYGLNRENTSIKTQSTIARAVFFAAILALVFVPSLIIEWPALDGIGWFGRVLGIGGFITVAVLVVHIAARTSCELLRLVWLAAIASLLVHAQIEMTFTQPGSVVWCLCAVGALGLGSRCGSPARNTDESQPGRGAAAWTIAIVNSVMLAGVVFIAVWIAVNGWFPAMQQERFMRAAAAQLAPIRTQPNDMNVLLKHRSAASEGLVAAYEQWPINVRPLNAAAVQLEIAYVAFVNRARTDSQSGGRGDEAGSATGMDAASVGGGPLGLLLRARDLLDIAIYTHDSVSSMANAVGVNVRLAQLTGDMEHWSRAIDLAKQVTQRDPHGLGAWKRLGDVLWAAGERREAAGAYQRALECDANFVLDELKRLSKEDRERLKERIENTTNPL